MKDQMFCFQCEQTAGCTGCTGVAGVCGKKAEFSQSYISTLSGKHNILSIIDGF